MGQIGHHHKGDGAGKSQRQQPEAGRGLEFDDAQQQHADQRGGGPDRHQISVLSHGEPLFHTEGKDQCQRAGTQQIQCQGAGDE